MEFFVIYLLLLVAWLPFVAAPNSGLNTIGRGASSFKLPESITVNQYSNPEDGSPSDDPSPSLCHFSPAEVIDFSRPDGYCAEREAEDGNRLYDIVVYKSNKIEACPTITFHVNKDGSTGSFKLQHQSIILPKASQSSPNSRFEAALVHILRFQTLREGFRKEVQQLPSSRSMATEIASNRKDLLTAAFITGLAIYEETKVVFSYANDNGYNDGTHAFETICIREGIVAGHQFSKEVFDYVKRIAYLYGCIYRLMEGKKFQAHPTAKLLDIIENEDEEYKTLKEVTASQNRAFRNPNHEGGTFHTGTQYREPNSHPLSRNSFFNVVAQHHSTLSLQSRALRDFQVFLYYGKVSKRV